ncbi:MAG: VanW family protein [Patescibacteria group bacterium]|nr:VanW family protein [Patescibacteria group bacterium]
MPKKIFKIFLIITIILLAILSISLIVLNFYYKDKFYPGTTIANYNVSGKTKKQASDFLNKKLEKFNQGIIFQNKDYNQKIKPELFGAEIDLEKTINQAYDKTYSGQKYNKTRNIIKTLIFKDHNDLIYSILPIKLENFYVQELSKLNQQKKETDISFQNNDFKIIPGKSGFSINEAFLTSIINKRIKNLSTKEIKVPLQKINPHDNKKEIFKTTLEAKNLVSQKIILEYEKNKWTVDQNILKSWANFALQKKRITSYPSLNKNYNTQELIYNILSSKQKNNFQYQLVAYFDRQKIGDYLSTYIAPKINQAPQNIRLQMQDNKLVILSPAKKGRDLLIEGNLENIITNIKGKNTKITLLTKTLGAEINKNNINELGIKELLGKGESNFSGSPANRIQNITVAAQKLNGILVKPDEEYSLVNNLGEVNAEAGYLPELVIKENKTIPEYGGGLCQIATTNFRAALNSALPITERQSHSYAVQYYDPQGTDAAIYIPHPDLKFHNNTKNYILIQTSIYNNILTFEFYGTKDGRSVRFEGPEYWDQKPDKSFKAKYSQIITYPDKSEKKSTFYSYYDNPDKYKHENQN